MFEELLDIPEGAGQFEALEALISLREDVATAKACCAQKEEELQHLREQTAELVAAQLAEDGADEDYVQAAKAMWLQAPHSVSQAIGIEVLKGANPYKTSTSDDLVEAERGCNQYKHKPGCPEAEGGGSDKSSNLKDKEAIKKNFEKLRQEVYDIEDEFMKYSNLIKKHGPEEMLDEEEEKFVNELKEKRKKIHERLKEAEKRYDAEVQRLRDNGLWGHL